MGRNDRPCGKAGEGMTDEEKKEYMASFMEQTKKYCRIDYDDDDSLIEMTIEAIFEKLGELIPNFNPYAMTSRQKLLAMMYVKNHYDHPDAYQGNDKKLSNAASSMLLNEMYGGGA